MDDAPGWSTSSDEGENSMSDDDYDDDDMEDETQSIWPRATGTEAAAPPTSWFGDGDNGWGADVGLQPAQSASPGSLDHSHLEISPVIDDKVNFLTTECQEHLQRLNDLVEAQTRASNAYLSDVKRLWKIMFRLQRRINMHEASSSRGAARKG
ncbi:hypothetical protein O9K51_10146 [Purpureocillium lavendulum]|uniref:Uncharacterized protein n=1 Tax=Purpureocillium lavendulum TaxID=1247861 RepID=A0AB34FED7_9HYPO|nr:hypothetical protein O9K51_10146 [Purpureocillium lavendulum]